MEKKVGRNTVKAFIRKNSDNLLILVNRRFDSMVDGCESTGQTEFTPALPSDLITNGNTMGIKGAWFVLGGRDFITTFETTTHVGYEVSNSCGSFKLAIAK